MPSMLEIAQARLGIEEVRGSKHNPAILAMWRDSGHPEIRTDEEFWCSAFACSCAKAAGLPMPPVNVNPMARSWLTWGKTVAKKDVQPDDVVVWPRGAPNSGSGHVNIVQDVRVRNGNVEVRCIGGNQSHPSGGAVTLTNWLDIRGCVGVRRAVAPTVKALREAGSTTIKASDQKKKLGVFAAFLAPIYKGIESLFGPVDVPQFASLSDGFTWWSALLGAGNALLDYVLAHPYLAATVIMGIGLWMLGNREASDRVAEHEAGVPIAAEVEALPEMVEA
jgi:uncharacterized protein (TIGR02594 family)